MKGNLLHRKMVGGKKFTKSVRDVPKSLSFRRLLPSIQIQKTQIRNTITYGITPELKRRIIKRRVLPYHENVRGCEHSSENVK